MDNGFSTIVLVPIVPALLSRFSLSW